MKYKKKIPLLICIAGLLSFILIFSFSFKIEQAGATELEVPTINVIPDIYNTDEILYIEGRAEPNSVVEIRFQRQGSKPVTFIIRADPGGEWVFAQRVDFSSGEYEVRARTRDGERASQWSNPRIFKTKVTGIVIGRVLGKFSLLSLTIFLLLLAGAGMALYFHLRVKRTKEESRQRFYEQKKELTLLEVEKDFEEIKSEIMEELENIQMADGKLTQDEVKHKELLLKQLNEIEEKIASKVKSIDKND